MDNNALLFIAVALIDLSFVLFAWWLGKNYLVATILVNIILTSTFVGKLIPIFSWVTTAAEVFYASIFIATDILSEHHGKKEAYRSIWMGFFVLLMFTLFGRIAIEFTTIEESSATAEAMQQIFTAIPRIAIASFTAYLIAQSFDIWFFHAIGEKIGKQKLWLRNNVSTLTSQLLDSLIFFPLAFLGTIPVNVLLTLIMTGWLFKIPIALLDTPFMYLSYIVKGQKAPDFGKMETSKTESPGSGIE
jgi:queuosine precursor transporter